MEITRNEARRRFEAEVENKLGVLEYHVAGKSIVFTHTGVPPEIEGRGIASALTKAGLEYAREHHLKVVPQCPFVREYLMKHSEYGDLLS
ncbi:MAG: N-acetyltransferase [Acidobacteriaceae bacterium]|nr:N-acetyltransferase [Acidobacteriaceae bacterium]MBV9034774.1 N-acetyltransferase [Acidobacteriaceae bacterium]MBV9305785.1 N-acetyltransferase [Acidobacteriaceae bacterium]MBV9939938.1 N-acetyltransferase [Acidobacteriaceae bacterium]